jgi:hypothetical protein
MRIRGRVGRHVHAGGRQCQNWPDDQRAIIAFLNLVLVEDGGAGGALGGRIISGIASEALCTAILRFEDRYFPGQRSGFVDPDGPMLKRMDELAARPSSRPVGPPSRNSVPTPEHVKALDDWLASITEGHPLAKNPWTFYDEIDAYLGPFGATGYPIGYGEKYCMLFNNNGRLKKDPQGRAWVRKTTIFLQTYVRQFIVERYRTGTLGSLTEEELRKAAFDSHPLAYTKGGLTLVALLAPELLPTIAAIPKAEFVGSRAGAAWRQFFVTGSLVIPEVAGYFGASMAGPAHTGIFSRAADQDFQRLMGHQRLATYLEQLRTAIADGQFNRIVWLQQITSRLDQTEFPDPAFAQLAGEIIRAADARKHQIAGQYRRDIALSSELRGHYDAYDPGWANW